MLIHQHQTVLTDVLTAHKQGRPVGLYSICSAHPFVLETCVRQALKNNSPLLIESTSNQVNQYGGYTGLTPVDFRRYVENIAAKFNFPAERLILGGDHLGLNPWQREAVEQAMARARNLIQVGYLARKRGEMSYKYCLAIVLYTH